MERITYYVIDTLTNRIINAVSSSSLQRAEAVLQSFEHPEMLRVDANPPMSMLRNYRYWNERP